jgi:hypothetical protein
MFQEKIMREQERQVFLVLIEVAVDLLGLQGVYRRKLIYGPLDQRISYQEIKNDRDSYNSKSPNDSIGKEYLREYPRASHYSRSGRSRTNTGSLNILSVVIDA